MNKEFIKELEQPYPKEVLVDTIKGRHPADEVIPVKGRWKWDNKRKYYYAAGLPFLDSTAKLLFKERQDKPYDGNVFCEFSAPKVLYSHNVCGVFYNDRATLFREPKELLKDYLINIDLARNPVDFSTFDVTRIDLSFCFFPKDDDEQQEFLRLFRNMYFENLIPGKSCSKEYDYKNGFAHTSPKLDIVLYDKAKKLNLKNIKLLRLEFRCKEPYKNDNAGSDFFDSFGNSMRKANKWLAKKLKKNNFTLPIVPREEQIKALTDYYNSKKNEYKGKPKKPLYLLSSLPKLLEYIEQINNQGCYEFHSSNRSMYCRCLKFAQDAGVHILYTELDHEISFIDDVCHHSDLHRVFGAKADKSVANKTTEEKDTVESESVDLHHVIDKPLLVETAKIYNICCSFEQSLSKKATHVDEITNSYLCNISLKERTATSCSDKGLVHYGCSEPIVKFSSSSVIEVINNIGCNCSFNKKILPLCSDKRFINYVSVPLKTPLYHRRI